MNLFVNREKLFRIIGTLEGLTWCADGKIAEALDGIVIDLLKIVEEE